MTGELYLRESLYIFSLCKLYYGYFSYQLESGDLARLFQVLIGKWRLGQLKYDFDIVTQTIVLAKFRDLPRVSIWGL